MICHSAHITAVSTKRKVNFDIRPEGCETTNQSSDVITLNTKSILSTRWLLCWQQCGCDWLRDAFCWHDERLRLSVSDKSQATVLSVAPLWSGYVASPFYFLPCLSHFTSPLFRTFNFRSFISSSFSVLLWAIYICLLLSPFVFVPWFSPSLSGALEKPSDNGLLHTYYIVCLYVRPHGTWRCPPNS